MIGGAPLLAMSQQLNEKFHKEHAKAMAAGQNAPRPHPTAYTKVEGGSWFKFDANNSIKFSDGTIYDCKLKAWRPARLEPVDPVLRWDEACAGDPLASNKMVLAGNQMVDEIRKLRAKLLDLEQEQRDKDKSGMFIRYDDDDQRDF